MNGFGFIRLTQPTTITHSPQKRTEPHCGREILFPIYIEAGMRLSQWERLVGFIKNHSPPY